MWVPTRNYVCRYIFCSVGLCVKPNRVVHSFVADVLLVLSNVNYMLTSHSLKRHLCMAFLRQFAKYERRNNRDTSCYLSFSFLHHPNSLKEGKHITPLNGKDSHYSRQPSDI